MNEFRTHYLPINSNPTFEFLHLVAKQIITIIWILLQLCQKNSLFILRNKILIRTPSPQHPKLSLARFDEECPWVVRFGKQRKHACHRSYSQHFCPYSQTILIFDLITYSTQILNSIIPYIAAPHKLSTTSRHLKTTNLQSIKVIDRLGYSDPHNITLFFHACLLKHWSLSVTSDQLLTIMAWPGVQTRKEGVARARGIP